MENNETNPLYEEQGIKKEDKKEKTKKNSFLKMIAGATVLGMIAGVALEGGKYGVYLLQQSKDAIEAAGEVENEEIKPGEVTSEQGYEIAGVVEQVMPAIVAIDTTITQDVTGIFGDTYQQESSGSGSGIIIGENESELLIVTNNHVIDGDNAVVKVTFSEGSVIDATVKGSDSSWDLAVLSVEKKLLSDEIKHNIRIATLGDSESMRVGEVVIAIGNALGYGQSVTVGYVGAKDRRVVVEDASMTLMQTDAAINPGNSGGALLNGAGEVIGINTMKYASEEVEGMGYAIPITKAIPIINELMNREQLRLEDQGYLGILGQDVTEQESKAYKMPQGVYVKEVTENSPADKGGIVVGNIITAFNGKEILTMENLQDSLTYTKAGSIVKITVKELVNGEYVEKEVEITLGSKSSSGTR